MNEGWVKDNRVNPDTTPGICLSLEYAVQMAWPGVQPKPAGAYLPPFSS